MRSTIMSGMSKSLKFPNIIKKRKAVSHGLPTFDLGKVTDLYAALVLVVSVQSISGTMYTAFKSKVLL